jgi:ribonuclease HII
VRCTARLENEIRRAGCKHVAGLDEAGRGCLLGPVFAAAVVLNPDRPIRGLNDSKALTPDVREDLRSRILERAQAWAVGSSDAEEIDRINILQASRLAMLRAIRGLGVVPDFLLIDAITVDSAIPQRAVIRGDAHCTCIAAASILAKTERDRHLVELSVRYPGYGLERNKGYGTPEHLAGLAALGVTPEHRKSFLPVQQYSLEF